MIARDQPAKQRRRMTHGRGRGAADKDATAVPTSDIADRKDVGDTTSMPVQAPALSKEDLDNL
jgi:hypothetical protein